MTTPKRPTRRAAFDTSAAEEQLLAVAEDTDSLLAALTGGTPAPARLKSVAPLADPPAAAVVVAEPAKIPPPEPAAPAGAVGDAAAVDNTAAVASSAEPMDADKPMRRGGASQRGNTRPGRARDEAPVKPPTAYLAHEVYARLLEFSEKERKQKRTTARPFGVIAMDAIEHHADKLESFWKSKGPAAPPPGGLFVRSKPSGRYRRHEQTPRSITLQGVGPENARLLKQLKNRWGAGSVSALVEQALRFELDV